MLLSSLSRNEMEGEAATRATAHWWIAVANSSCWRATATVHPDISGAEVQVKCACLSRP